MKPHFLPRRRQADFRRLDTAHGVPMSYLRWSGQKTDKPAPDNAPRNESREKGGEA